MKIHLRALFFFLSVTAVACSSSSIKITTNPPGAEVYVKSLGQSERADAGKTPIENTKFSEFIKGKPGGPVIIDIEKPGFQTASILIPEVGNGSIEITEELKPSADPLSASHSLELNKGLDELFEAQRLARVGRLDDALKALDLIAKNYPQLSAVPEIRGGIFYLKKDYSKALDEYRRSLAMDGENASAQSMVKRLEAQLAGHAPAAPASTQPPPAAPAGAPSGNK